jgi:hypothetical protein
MRSSRLRALFRNSLEEKPMKLSRPRSRRIRPLATFFGLLAVISLSGAASAATFTLQELYDGGEFTIGSTQFSGFAPATPGSAGTVDPNNVIVETVENSGLLGFTVSSDEFSGNSSLLFNHQVVQTDSRVINAASLWITDLDFGLTSDFAVRISARECEVGPGSGGPGDCNAVTNPRPDLMVERTSDPGSGGEPIINLFDADVFMPSHPGGEVFRVRTELETLLDGGGSVALNRYAALYSVVPEPGTALLLGLGMAGLSVVGRPRRA